MEHAEKSKRQLNYELLRILAMLMIVCLHYLWKGGFLGDPARAEMAVTGYAAWLIEAFCIVAVNVYVLISGYFGAESNINASDVLARPLKIWKQVFFYAAAIGAVTMILSVLLPEMGTVPKPDKYRIFMYIFPIVTEHYWFATSYIILCFFMPFLDRGLKTLDKKSLGQLVGAFLLMFSLSKTFMPMALPWDNAGYDAFWFAALYITGGYIRLYGMPFIDSRLKAAALYIVSVFAIFISFLAIRRVYFASGSFKTFIKYGYSYNYLFCYLGAIGLFMAFSDAFSVKRNSNHLRQRRLRGEFLNFTQKKGDGRSGKLERIRKPIELVSGAAFGVYLIHEHIDIRYLWVTWFNCKDYANAPLFAFLGHMVFTVLTVYIVCTLIEIARQKIAMQFIAWRYREK